MPAKSLQKAKKVKDINRYVGEFAVFELKKPLKVKNFTEKVDFLLLGRARFVSGGPKVQAWASDENGRVLDNRAIYDSAGESIGDALAKLGYTL